MDDLILKLEKLLSLPSGEEAFNEFLFILNESKNLSAESCIKFYAQAVLMMENNNEYRSYISKVRR